MVPEPQVLATLVVEGPDRAEPAPLPTTLLAVDDLRRATVDRRRTFRLEEREPRIAGPLGAFEYHINGRTVDVSRGADPRGPREMQILEVDGKDGPGPRRLPGPGGRHGHHER